MSASLGTVGLDVASWITNTWYEHDEECEITTVILTSHLAPHLAEIAAALEPIGGALFPERYLFGTADVMVAFAPLGHAELDNPVALLAWNGRPWHEQPGAAYVSHKSWSQMCRDAWYGGRRHAEVVAEFESWAVGS